MASDQPTGLIATVSGKGGVWKTATAVNLAGALLSMGAPITLIDLDYGASATRHFGYQPKSPYAEALLDGKIAIDRALDTEEGIKLVATNAAISQTPKAKTLPWRDALLELKKKNLIIIDTSDDIMSAPVAAAILAADILVIPTALNDVTYERTFPEIGGLLEAHRHTPEQLWIATGTARKTKLSEDMERIIAKDGRELVARIPLGVAALEAKRKQLSVIAYDRRSTVAKAYLDLGKLVYAKLRKLNGARPAITGREMPDLEVTA